MSHNPQLTTRNPFPTRNLIMLIFLSSCSVLKNKDLLKTDSLERREVTTTEQTSGISRLTQQHVLLLTDSSGTDFLTEIIPEGEFRFSQQEGFTGKASLIRIKGNSRRNLTLQDSGSLDSSSLLNKKTKSKEKRNIQVSSKSKAKEVKSNRPVSFWFWIGVLVAVGGVVSGGRYLKKKMDGAAR